MIRPPLTPRFLLLFTLTATPALAQLPPPAPSPPPAPGSPPTPASAPEFAPPLNFLFPTRAATFVLGNINLFFDANPAPGWRSLVEIRFTNLPHGEEISFADPLGGQYERRDTRVSDFTSTSLRNDVVLGSIIIERAWAEYAFDDALKIQTGYFLTPYGIWNQDHGTPTLISLLLPAFQADQYIPNRQLGIQLYGSFYPTGWQLSYHAYVANSRGPSQVDLANEKAFGGRLFASNLGSYLKATVRAARTPVIAVTAHAVEGERAKAIAAGMDDHISKPVSPGALGAMLARYLPSVEQVSTIPAPRSRSERTLDPERTRSQRVVDLFLKVAPTQVETLLEAIAVGDLDHVKASAYKLRGSSLSIGAPRMARLCGELEEHPMISGLAREIAGALDEVRRELVRAGANS